jgi:flagellar basal-body rod modification protein FlgD
LNPMDNAQITTQLAQISTVQGIEQLNTTMGKFADTATKNRPSDSVGLIGQTVLTAGTSVSLTAGQSAAVAAGVDLSADADRVQVDLLSLGGQVVDSRTFTNQAQGTISLQWTGKDSTGADLATGNYTMRVTATAAGQPVTATALTSAQVVGVTQGNGTTNVALASGASVSVEDVKGVFRP